MRAGAGQSQSERAAAFLAAIVESAEDAIVGKNLDGIIQSWNVGAERLYGYSAGEALGKSMTILLPPDRPEEEEAILARIRDGRPVEHLRTVRLRSDGRPVHVSLTISPIRDAAGVVVGASHIARDIGERVQLEHTAARLAAIVESSDDAIVSKNLDGVILTWNAGAERIYGYTAEEAAGKPMAMLLPPERREEEDHILESLRRGDRVEHFETVRVRKDGKRIDVSLTISPIRDGQGRIRGASHVARDITQRKAFEAQLRHTQKLESLGVLAGGVAHDFNNLLTGIMANASLAAESPGADASTRKLMDDVVRAAERAAGLTRQLLAYAGKGRFVTEPVDLSGLVDDIGALLKTSIPRKVELQFDLARDLPPVEGDPGQLQQVIMNLVINGAEAIGDAAGVVRVSTRVQVVDQTWSRTIVGIPDLKPGLYVLLEVEDEGCGMDEDTIARIFDPFFTTKSAGRGLGLAAVLGIVHGHKGALKVYSAPGRGATFRLLLPVAEGRPRPRDEKAEAALEGRGTVLIVDDEESVRNAARNSLVHFGYTVLLAANGREASEIVRRRGDSIDLVLLDLTMPEMGGEEALLHIKTLQPGIRVLLSSGFNQVDVIRRFQGQGLAGFIQKPYTAAQLAASVKAVVG